jgi:hypothetical protein
MLSPLPRRTLLAGFAALASTTLAPMILAGRASARKPAVFTEILPGVAVGGHDPVAYFTESKAVLGSADITFEHEGAVWRFASTANREAFQADPAKFAPQYGGYCAFAVANGYTAKGDPQAWTLANDKLYLNYNKSVQRGWEQDIPGNVRKGDANWPKVLG